MSIDTKLTRPTTNNFIDHPLAPLYFQYIDILKAHNKFAEAEKLLRIATEPLTKESMDIIADVIISIEKVASEGEYNEFSELNSQLNNPN